MSECSHDKVYSMWILLSMPPQRDWVCRKCGAEGREVAGPPTTFADEYTAIKEKFVKNKLDKNSF